MNYRTVIMLVCAIVAAYILMVMIDQYAPSAYDNISKFVTMFALVSIIGLLLGVRFGGKRR